MQGKKGHSCQIANVSLNALNESWECCKENLNVFLFCQQHAAFSSEQLTRKNSHPINRKVLRAEKESSLLKGYASVCIKGRRTAAANQRGRKQSDVRGGQIISVVFTAFFLRESG